MPSRATTPTTAAAIVAAYVAGAPVKVICAQYFISRFVMTQALKAAGVPRRPRGRPRTTKGATMMTEELRCVLAVPALLAVLEAGRACADDLEAEIAARYPDRRWPSMQRRYERDMEPVTRLRAALEALGDAR